MSALPLKADSCSATAYVRFGPKADIDAGSASVGRDAVVYLYAWRDLDQSITLRSLYSSTRSAFPLNLAIASFSIHQRASFLLRKTRRSLGRSFSPMTTASHGRNL